MYSQELNQQNCRICLEENAEKDWNDCINDDDILTYRDCYYKYTNLAAFDEEDLYLSTIICRCCCDNLKNINGFVSKAIEIHNLLQESFALQNKHEDFKTNFETILMPEIDIKPELQNLSKYDGSSEVSMYDSSEENDMWIAPETNTSMEQPKENEMENIENEEKTSKRSRKPWKSWMIPTCCSICSKLCYSKYKAAAHEKTHLKDRERNETCTECGMKFYDKTCLRAHVKTHAENRVKTKKCDYCDKAFYDTGALNIHRRIHLGQMIKCTLCTKEYCRQVDLDKHMLSHSTTKINGEVKPQKKYFVCCEFCGDNIRSLYYKTHLAKHNNEPLAKCAICNKEFFSKNSCNKHLKSVHRKGKEERRNFLIAYKTNHYSNLFLQQKTPKLFTEEYEMV